MYGIEIIISTARVVRKLSVTLLISFCSLYAHKETYFKRIKADLQCCKLKNYIHAGVIPAGGVGIQFTGFSVWSEKICLWFVQQRIHTGTKAEHLVMIFWRI